MTREEETLDAMFCGDTEVKVVAIKSEGVQREIYVERGGNTLKHFEPYEVQAAMDWASGYARGYKENKSSKTSIRGRLVAAVKRLTP